MAWHGLGNTYITLNIERILSPCSLMSGINGSKVIRAEMESGMSKPCTTCKVEKPLSEFHKNKGRKDGYGYQCKTCKAAERKTRRPLENALKRKQYWSNIEKERERLKLSQQKHKSKPSRVFRARFTNVAKHSIYRCGQTKQLSSEVIIGLSPNAFKRYIEKQFKPGMSWDNYGEWHIDHIIPLSIARSEIAAIRLNNYTNLRPLWAVENQAKGGKIPSEDELIQYGLNNLFNEVAYGTALF
jgi:hypothetical protein